MTSPVYLAALLGPVTKTEASDLYSQLRKSNSKQRLSDPLRYRGIFPAQEGQLKTETVQNDTQKEICDTR